LDPDSRRKRRKEKIYPKKGSWTTLTKKIRVLQKKTQSKKRSTKEGEKERQRHEEST
jgi:hypothetical protein